MKESLRCECSGGFRDQILHTDAHTRATLESRVQPAAGRFMALAAVKAGVRVRPAPSLSVVLRHSGSWPWQWAVLMHR